MPQVGVHDKDQEEQGDTDTYRPGKAVVHRVGARQRRPDTAPVFLFMFVLVFDRQKIRSFARPGRSEGRYS